MGLFERLPHPFGNRHLPRACGTLNLAVFRIFEDDLQSFSHMLSIFESYQTILPFTAVSQPRGSVRPVPLFLSTCLSNQPSNRRPNNL